MLNGIEFQTVGAAYLKALRPTDLSCAMHYKDDYIFSTAQLSFTYTGLSPTINYTNFKQHNINLSETKYHF